jgi:hypothetical protein
VSERRVPPVGSLGTVSMVLTIASVIYLAAYIPKVPPLGPAIGLMAAAGVVLLANVVLLVRTRDFAWRPFKLVFGWALVAYIVIAGMLEYVFLYDHTRGGVLALMTLSLMSFTVNVPLLLGFGVARYQTA